MKYYIFKSPRKPGDKHIKEFNFEPTEFMIQHEAFKHGPIIMYSADELIAILKKEEAERNDKINKTDQKNF